MLFEHENRGISDFMYVDDLKKILTENAENCKDIKFVVISACKSYNVGMTFFEVGRISHVVCI